METDLKTHSLQDVASDLENSISAIESCLFPQSPAEEALDKVPQNTLLTLRQRLEDVNDRMEKVRKELNGL